jgi:hypothetical protein
MPDYDLFKPNPRLTKKRLENNKAILSVLANFFAENPDQRFGQALFNLDILTLNEDSEMINPYHTESKASLTAAKAAMKKIRKAVQAVERERTKAK